MNYELLTDEILVKLLKTSDEKAFKTIYERYWKKLFLHAYYKIHTAVASEEIIQEIFTSLWEKRMSSNIEHLENYLNGAVKFQVINYIRSHKLRQDKLTKLQVTNTDNSTEAAIAVNNLNAAIQNALALLPEKTREVFTLSRFEQQPVKEIAKRLNLSEKAVEYHITQSLKLMRMHLKEFIVMELIVVLLQ